MERNFYRLYGNTRYRTTLLAAEEYRKKLGVDKFRAVILSTGENFPDALTGSCLAVKESAPIILVNTASAKVVTMVSEYVKKNLASDGKIYILGGEKAVTPAMEEALAGFSIERIQGKTRYVTNLEILKRFQVKEGDEILVTTGENYPDSLSASSTGKPILMVKEKLTAAQKEYLASFHGNITLTILGGDKAISEDMAAELQQYTNGTMERLSGATRRDTSVMIAEKYFGHVDTVILAYAENYPDGLSAGPLGYVLKAPVIMTETGKDKAADRYTEDKYLFTGYVFGGTKLINDDTAVKIFNIRSAEEIQIIHEMPQ